MSAFAYRDGWLHAEGVDLRRIAEQVGTPSYVYASAALEDAYRSFAGAFAEVDALVCYALKANGNLAVMRTFAALGAGADVVSEGELARALAAGVPPQRIVFAGVGKTAAEMEQGLAAGILQFNVESEPELALLDAVARRLGKRAPVAVRVNPDVDARTYPEISTGMKDNKFGIALERAVAVYDRARALPGIDLGGVAVHIGSQLTHIEPYQEAFERLVALVRELRAGGHDIRRLDLGGGLGVRYRDETPPSVARYSSMVKQATSGLGCKLVLEPGRFLVAGAGVLLARVLYVKETAERTFVILDAAMNDLIRPALYKAWHELRPVREPAPGAPVAAVDIVGPVCETTDTFARDRALPRVEAGDLVAFGMAGAYGAVMSSSYNARPPAPEVLVRDGAFAVVKPRRTVAELFADERLPDWLAPGGAGPQPVGA